MILLVEINCDIIIWNEKKISYLIQDIIKELGK